MLEILIKMAPARRVETDGWSTPNEVPPTPPAVGDILTIEGVDKRFRVAEVSEHEGIYSCRIEEELNWPSVDAALKGLD
jgi:hypothetical protein